MGVTDGGTVKQNIPTRIEPLPKVVLNSLETGPKTSIPHILWLNMHHVPGRDSERSNVR